MINLKNIQTEIDASFLYGVLADHEEDPNVGIRDSGKLFLALLPQPLLSGSVN